MEFDTIPYSQLQEPYGFAAIFEAHRQEIIIHLLTMAKMQGYKHHTWHRVKELENEPYGFYKGIQEEFLNKIKGVDNESV